MGAVTFVAAKDARPNLYVSAHPKSLMPNRSMDNTGAVRILDYPCSSLGLGLSMLPQTPHLSNRTRRLCLHDPCQLALLL